MSNGTGFIFAENSKQIIYLHMFKKITIYLGI